MIRFQSYSRKHTQPRPTLWRLALVQCGAWLVALLGCAFWVYEYTASVWWSGLIAMVAQGFWVWRTLRNFGDPGSAAYFAGTAVGMLGKWVMIFIGLLVLWRYHPDVSIMASVVTVFALNTLAALAAPIVISRPR